MKSLQKATGALLLGGLAAAVVGLLSHAATAQEPAAERKLAFLVGIREYKHLEFKDLDFPENDVEDFAAALKAHNFTTVVLTTARGRKDSALTPTAENIRAQLKSLLSDVSKHDLIIVGLAGHGIQPLESDESFFCPMDANPVVENGRPVDPSRLIALGELLGQLRKSGIGEKLVLIDACRNDPSVRGRRGVDHVNVSALPVQTGVLLSCSQGEFSFENKSLGRGHGAFFYHVIEGFNGNAKDQEGAVTWDSLRTYVKTQVPRTVGKLFGSGGGEQNPNEIGNLGGTPTVLARIDRPSIGPSTSTPTEEKPKENARGDDPWVKEAEHLLQVGNYDDLDTLAKARLRQAPESTAALTYRAAILNHNSQTDDALDTVNKAIRLDKGLARAYDTRGDAYSAKADYDLALRDYSEAIRLAPESAEYYVDRGSCYYPMKSWNLAIADANQALQLDAESADAYLLRAEAKTGESGGGNWPNETAAPDAREAVRLFQKKIESDSRDRRALRGLAVAYAWLNDHKRSIETYNKLIRQGWGTSNDYFGRGSQYFGLEQYEWAVADFTKAIDRNPHFSMAYANRGSIYSALKRYDDAIADATEAIRLDPRNAFAYNIRGIAYGRKNNVELARADYQQSLRLDPNNRLYRDNLEKLDK